MPVRYARGVLPFARKCRRIGAMTRLVIARLALRGERFRTSRTSLEGLGRVTSPLWSRISMTTTDSPSASSGVGAASLGRRQFDDDGVAVCRLHHLRELTRLSRRRASSGFARSICSAGGATAVGASAPDLPAASLFYSRRHTRTGCRSRRVRLSHPTEGGWSSQRAVVVCSRCIRRGVRCVLRQDLSTHKQERTWVI